ncbi:MAG: ABC transporter substrate-binding protein [Gemmatimonadota bacterium]|nr:ABC transporter substrate-binding protein [Gemmatimonadota bacterium]
MNAPSSTSPRRPLPSARRRPGSLRRSAAPPALLAALLLAAAGCDAGRDAGDEAPPPTSWGRGGDGAAAEARPRVPEEERYGGTVVVAGPGDLLTMNPLIVADRPSLEHQIHLLHITLVAEGPGAEPLPRLAESWSFDARGDRVTFRLRDDVRWHDGHPVTARDVAFTWERAIDPAVPFANPAYFDAWEAAEVLDEHTIRFTVRPRAHLLYGWMRTAILPEHILGDVPPEELERHPFGTTEPVGAGPFRFLRRVPGDRWVFEANPDFPEALGGRPYVDRYVYRQIPDGAVAEAELKRGRVHLLLDVTPDAAARLAADTAVAVAGFAAPEYAFIAWNTRRPPLTDPAVRRALTLAIDREGIREVVRGPYGRVLAGPVGRWHPAFDSTLAPLPFAPDSARTLLAAAGWTDSDGDGIRDRDGRSFQFDLLHTPRDDWAQVAAIAQANLRDVGVEVSTRVREQAALVPLVTGPDRRFDAFLVGWVRDVMLDDRDMFACDRPTSPFQFTGWCRPELDALLDSLQLVVGPDVQARLVARYGRMVAEAQPYTFLYDVESVLARRRELRGVRPDARAAILGAAEWWLEPRARGDRAESRR